MRELKKRLYSGLLAAVMLFALAPAALAAAEATDSDKIQALSALEIMTGDQDGNLNLGGAVTRAEFAKMAVAASKWKEGVGDTASVSPYPDVPKANWAAPWIQAAVSAELVRGNLHGYFEPGRTITMAEGVTIVLRLLGHQDSAFTGTYPAGQMAMYRALNLDRGITTGAAGAMSRRDAMNLFYNLMTAKTTTGAYYLNTIRTGASSAGSAAGSGTQPGTLPSSTNLVNAAGEIDRVALINSAMEGPVVAAAGWQSLIPFSTANTTIYRGGVRSTLAQIGPTDVVYYSKSMRTLWAYNNSITGTLEKISPSASAPTGVTVAGKSYAIENATAAYDLSDLGAFRVGDAVTLLLGREGGVAAARKLAEGTIGTTIYGVATGVDTGTYQDAKGNSYQSDTVQVKTTAGGDYTYRSADVKYYKVGDLIRITTQGGDVQAKRMGMTRLAGQVSRDGKQLGDYVFASDVNILDTYGKTGILHLYPSRIAGMSLAENQVKFYARNAQGEISDLILDDATGDLHKYGVLTGATESNDALEIVGEYACIIDGGAITYQTKTLYWPKTGPVEVKAEGTKLEYIKNLTGIALDTVDGNIATAQNNQKYTISDSVAVYEKRDNGFYLTDLARMTGSGYTLTGYYDKAESEGGRIRVITASAS